MFGHKQSLDNALTLAARERLLRLPHAGWLLKRRKRANWRGHMGFQLRYFTLDKEVLSYFKSPSDRRPLGTIALSSVLRCDAPSLVMPDCQECFDLVCKDRTYTLQPTIDEASESTGIAFSEAVIITAEMRRHLREFFDTAHPPPEARVHELFESLVEELLLESTSQGNKIRDTPLDKKWLLICAHAEVMQQHALGDVPIATAEISVNVSKWLSLLTDPGRLSVADLRYLTTAIRTCSRPWLSAFLQADGARLIVRALRELQQHMGRSEQDRERGLELLMCFKVLINNPLGMEAVLDLPDGLTAVSLLGTPDHPVLLEQALDLLAVACWYSPLGHARALQAMEAQSRTLQEPRRFFGLVETMRQSSDLALLTHCMRFINALVNAPPMLADRVAVRNDFLAMDVLREMHSVCDDTDAAINDMYARRARATAEREEREDTMTPGASAEAVTATDQGVKQDEAELASVAAADERDAGPVLPSTQEIDELETALRALKAQVEVFEGMWKSDHEETVRNGVDLSSVKTVLAALEKAAARGGFSPQLLCIMQQFLLIPTDPTLGGALWDRAVACLTELVQQPSRSAALSYRQDYHRVQALLDWREQLDGQLRHLAALQEYAVEKRSECRHLQQELLDALRSADRSAIESAGDGKDGGVAARISGIEAVLAAAPAPLPDGTAPLAPPPPPDVAPAEQLGPARPPADSTQRAQAASPLAADRAAVPCKSAPPAAQCAPPPPPPLPVAPGPGRGVPVAPPFPGRAPPPAPPLPAPIRGVLPTPRPLGRGPPAAPPLPSRAPTAATHTAALPALVHASGARGVPVAPPVPPSRLGAAAPPEVQAGLAPKPKIPHSEGIKMRGLYWSRVDPRRVPETIWSSITDAHVPVDHGKLEKWFGVPAGSPKAAEGRARQPPAGDAQQLVQLLQPSRQRNIGISLARVRLPLPALCDAILALDASVVSVELAQVLLGILPTEEEELVLREYPGPPDQLPRPERFFYELLRVPQAATRLRVLHALHTFHATATDLAGRVKAVRQACDSVGQSHKLLALLEMVLAVGNHLNGPSPRGGAYGFLLESLDKLPTVKHVREAHLTLVHFLADMVDQRSQVLLSLPDEWEHVREASKWSMQDLEADLAALRRAVQDARSLLDASAPAEGPRTLPDFVSHAEACVEEAAAELSIAKEKYGGLAKRFCEPSSTGHGEFFARLLRFLDALRSARDESAARRMREKRAERRVVERAAWAGAREGAGTSKFGGAGGVAAEPSTVQEFMSSQQGDAPSILRELRSRHKRLSAVPQSGTARFPAHATLPPH